MSRAWKFYNSEGVYFVSCAVDESLVYKPEEYVYSSAKDYAGEQGLIEGVTVVY